MCYRVIVRLRTLTRLRYRCASLSELGAGGMTHIFCSQRRLSYAITITVNSGRAKRLSGVAAPKQAGSATTAGHGGDGRQNDARVTCTKGVGGDGAGGLWPYTAELVEGILAGSRTSLSRAITLGGY